MNNFNQNSINKENGKTELEKWETPVLLELDASNSESMFLTTADDADGGPKPS